ncbi:MAG: type II secretion system GspH family protein [Phycisphaerales bacterium]|nr:type II secretion system GspH family protein [Phycisphaerales bacterium]
MPPARTNRHHGFTLIELVIVTAILAMLAAILVPSLQSMAHRSKVTKDLVNLRSLQTAHFQYAVASKGKFADAGLAHGGLKNEQIAWLNLVGEYVEIDDVVRSPLDMSMHWTVPIEGTTDRFRRTSYGWNNYLSRTHSPDAAIDPRAAVDRLSRVKSTSKTVHFLHMTGTGSFAGADHVHVENWWIGDSQPDVPPILAANHVQTNVVSGDAKTYGARSNYGFIDGHVETLYFSDVYQRPDRNRFDPEVAARG